MSRLEGTVWAFFFFDELLDLGWNGCIVSF
jgi:hypothetical protein